MRLSKIKLAGFKSFVDPTTIPFASSNLSAVVGPNGCGKSNVIDAVRWVMGESHAKNLRGGSITDVIFNGSANRKPVGMATVELLFDNSDGKLGGEYAKYAEIALKRQVTRDGQSSYFLNGQRCRRRDITDIFLGTGLGPRSYAIIEQGMISRVIEAKPEDLRVFLEEAAGISKYKERRRETENRIQHTQENLARLNDLRQELDNQLTKLQRQSQAAERYKQLKAQEQELSLQLSALAWHRLDQEAKDYEAQIREISVQLEEKLADFQHIKTQQEKQRIEQAEANEDLNEVQKRYYSVGTELAKIEQAIQHHQERQSQLNVDKQDAEQSLINAQAQLQQDEENISHLQTLIAEMEPEFANLGEEQKIAIEAQQQMEMALEECREKVAQLQQMTMAPTRQAEAEKAKITQLERQIQQTQERSQRLETELQQFPTPDPAELAIFDEKMMGLEQQAENLAQRLIEYVSRKDSLTQEIQTCRVQIKELEQKLSEAQGQQSALLTLQSAALGKDKNTRLDWLKEKGLENSHYLAEKIEVQAPWGEALETVLEGFLEAIGVEQGRLLDYAQDFAALEEVGISLLEWDHPATVDTAQTLAHFVTHPEHLPKAIYDILCSVRVSSTLDEAKALLPALGKHQSVITPQGWWLGPGWIKIKAKQQAGILQREEKLKLLAQDIAVNQEKLVILQAELGDKEEEIKLVESEKEACQQEKGHVQHEMVTLQSEQRIRQNRFEQQQKRLQQIQQEIAEYQQLIQQSQQDVNVARSQLQEALEQMAQFNQESEDLNQQKNHLQDELMSVRLRAKEASNKAQQMALTLQGHRTQLTGLTANIERQQRQIALVQERLESLSQALIRNEEPMGTLKEELEIHLEKRISIEDELNRARDRVAGGDNILRELEQRFNQVEQKITFYREQLERSKMEWQALSVRRETVLEKLKNIEMTIENILATLPPEANEAQWQEELTAVEQKIQRLGAINLAAIEEYQAAQERKVYLDSQCDDLLEALTTLENAIKKIDKETRAKFQETFDKVSLEFTRLFPILFGGGQATLTLTGEDLLDTGISVMARPPGKKNSTIALLSGGEKALTAVALVFAIFQLNPAPFCMLDEVDAPLDDNNVGRFCNLVKEMSKSVQFIYISHNKIAIEMAQQLQGVTMREPGVSRLVNVDIEEAKTMAEA